jgi:hypothetical protein
VYLSGFYYIHHLIFETKETEKREEKSREGGREGGSEREIKRSKRETCVRKRPVA